MKLTYLQHKEIDINKWDKCIEYSVNGSFQALSWFLNTICQSWDAIIDEKYNCVMPLPIITKGRKKIILQPKFAKHLGIYSTSVINDTMIESFIKAIPQSLSYASIQFNKYNKIQSLPGYSVEKGYSYDIDLILSYHKLVEAYSDNGVESIKKAQSYKFHIVYGMQAKDLINFYSDNKTNSSDTLSKTDLQTLELIILYALRNAIGEVIGVYNTGNKLCAVLFFIGSHQKITLLFFAQNKSALINKALYLVIDSFIKKHAEKNIILNYTGTIFNINFCDFGGLRSEYFKLKYNRLPFYSSLFLNIR